MVIDELNQKSPVVREKIKRIEGYFNLVKKTDILMMKEYYKKLLKENIALLTKEGITVDLKKLNDMVNDLG